MNTGTLLLDLQTITGSPKFFSILALVLRAAGFEVIVLDGHANRRNGAKLAAGLGIPLVAYDQWSGAGDRQQWKFEVATHRKTPCIFIDEELGSWHGPDVNNREGLVALNWRKVLEQGNVKVAEG